MILLGALIVGVLALPPAPDVDHLGTVSFPTSCSSAVQPVIEHGVALLHSFRYDEAAHVFDDAAHRDASCAMCHWGKAYQAPTQRECVRRTIRTIDQGRMSQPGDPTWVRHLRQTIREFAKHYHGERNHQGLGNELINGTRAVEVGGSRIRRRQRLGGLLNYYYRAA